MKKLAEKKGCWTKNSGDFTPKMDGENNAKPYFLIDNLEGNTPFLETPKYTPIGNARFFFSKEISPTDDGWFSPLEKN